MKYDLYSEFDIQKHKEKYIHYLEIIIEKDGSIHYAIPSHQEYLINLACKQKQIDRNQLYDMCPEEYYFDFITWLSMQTNAIAVWEHGYIGNNINSHQKSSLINLKKNGLYIGKCK